MGEWFDTGLKMSDKKTSRTVYASDELQCEKFLKKGWKAVAKKKAVVKKKAEVKKTATVKKKVVRRPSALRKALKVEKDE